MNKILIFIFAIAVFASCNLEKEIDLNLPEFESQLVVECYLEPGKPYRANIFQTTSYYAPTSDLFNSVVQNATVIITYQGVSVTLSPGIYVDIKFNQTPMAYQTVAGISQYSLTNFTFHGR
jgi:hypothetical protein